MSYWDKEKKAPRSRQTYLGKLDPETGKLIAAKRRMPRKSKPEPSLSAVQLASPVAPCPQAATESEPQAPTFSSASVKVIGPSSILEKLADETGLAALLRRCFPLIQRPHFEPGFFHRSEGVAIVAMPVMESMDTTAGP